MRDLSASAGRQAEDIHAADTSFDILQAAASCFMERGYSASSIDDVARRLGSTKGRIYHHYPSKADLFAHVFKTGMDMNFDAIVPEARRNIAPIERLMRMARAHTGNLIRTRPFQRAVWEGVELHLRGATTPEQRETLTELLKYRDRYSDIFKSVISECREAGDLDFENLSVANQLMLVALNSPIFWYRPRSKKRRDDFDAVVEQVVGFAMRGLGYKGALTK